MWLCIEMSIRFVVSHCKSWRNSFSHVPLMILKAETCSTSVRHNCWATAILFCWLWAGQYSGWVCGKAQRPSNTIPGWEQREWQLPCVAPVNPLSHEIVMEKLTQKLSQNPKNNTKVWPRLFTATPPTSETLLRPWWLFWAGSSQALGWW